MNGTNDGADARRRRPASAARPAGRRAHDRVRPLAGVMLLAWLLAAPIAACVGVARADAGRGEATPEAAASDPPTAVSTRGSATLTSVAGETVEDDEVRISEAAVARAGISTGVADPCPVDAGVDVPAEVRFLAPRVVSVVAPLEAHVESVAVQVGDRVAAGDDVVRIRSLDLGVAGAELRRVEARIDMERARVERQRELRRDGINAERELRDAEGALALALADRDVIRARTAVHGTRGGGAATRGLSSPIAGRVIERDARVGAHVDPSQTLLVIADPSRLELVGHVPVSAQHLVREGLSVTFVRHGEPDRTWTSHVERVASRLDPATRTLAVFAEIDNADEALRDGQFGTLRLRGAAPSSTCVTIPADAVQRVAGRTVVFVPGASPGAYVARPVHVARRSGGRAWLEQGIAVGDTFVASGAFVLTSELLRADLESALEE